MRADDEVPLGRTGVRVTRLGLGPASLGGLFAPVSADAAARTPGTPCWTSPASTTCCLRVRHAASR